MSEEKCEARVFDERLQDYVCMLAVCGLQFVDKCPVTLCDGNTKCYYKENKRLREALNKIAEIESYKDCEQIPYICCSKCKNGDKCIYYLAATALRGYKCD